MKFDTSKTLKLFTVIVPIGILTVAILSYFNSVKKEKSISIELTNINHLTKLEKASGLKGYFYHKDSLIYSLYSVQLNIQNDGEETLIGKGESKDLIDSTLNIKFNTGFEIVDYKIKSKMIESSEISTMNNVLDFHFYQLEPNEKVDLLLYLKSNKDVGIPSIKVNKKNLIKGKIKVYTNEKVIIEKKSYLSRFYPKTIEIVVKLLILFIMCFASMFFGSAMVYSLYENIKKIQWNRKYKGIVSDDLSKMTDNDISKYMKYPRLDKDDKIIISMQNNPYKVNDYFKDSYFNDLSINRGPTHILFGEGIYYILLAFLGIILLVFSCISSLLLILPL